MISTGRVSLLGVMLANAGVSSATRGTLSVTEGGITFTVVRYDDGRNRPYRLRFRQDGTRSLYTLDSATRVTNIKIGEAERYQVRRCRIPRSKCALMARIRMIARCYGVPGIN